MKPKFPDMFSVRMNFSIVLVLGLRGARIFITNDFLGGFLKEKITKRVFRRIFMMNIHISFLTIIVK